MLKEVTLLGILCLFMVNGNVEDNSSINDLFNMNMLTKFAKMNNFFREKNFIKFGNTGSKLSSLPKLSVDCTAAVINLTSPFVGLNTSEIIEKLFTTNLGKCKYIFVLKNFNVCFISLIYISLFYILD